MILLTGATGRIGGATADALIKSGAILRALVRDPAKAKPLAEAGVEIVVGDLGDALALKAALNDIEKVFLVTSNSRQQRSLEQNFIDAALAAGVGHVVKLSSMGAMPGAAHAIPLAHAESETQLRASGMQWTMIRPSIFMQNFLMHAEGIKAQGKFFLPCGAARVGFVDLQDVAAVIATVLTQNGHENKSYDLTGPEALSFQEVAAKFSAALGREISYVDAPPGPYRDMLAQALGDPWRARAVTDVLSDVSAGSLDRTTDCIKKILGRDPGTMDHFIQNHIGAFM